MWDAGGPGGLHPQHLKDMISISAGEGWSLTPCSSNGLCQHGFVVLKKPLSVWPFFLLCLPGSLENGR